MKKKMKKPQTDINKIYEELKGCRGEIKEAYEDMLMRIAITAEYKDRGAGGHIRRVSDYSCAIAASMGLPAEEISVLRYASMMHDIGKIGIPDRILGKDTSLSSEEHDEIKQHTVIGSRIFEGSKFPLVKAAAQIALTHHEKYDGTGYPKGLKQEETPLYGRIVSVADHFDALVSERCYKNAVKFDEAVREIEDKAGTFFDPKVVIAFIKVRDKIKEILDANALIDDFVKDVI